MSRTPIFSPERINEYADTYPIVGNLRDLLEKAVALTEAEYVRAVANNNGIEPWHAYATKGQLDGSNGGRLDLRVDDILINSTYACDIAKSGQPVHRHTPYPALLEIMAIEEAIRVRAIREMIFGENGLLRAPKASNYHEDLSQLQIVADESADYIKSKLLEGGFIDPYFKATVARKGGLEAVGPMLVDRSVLKPYLDQSIDKASKLTSFSAARGLEGVISRAQRHVGQIVELYDTEIQAIMRIGAQPD